MYALRERSSSVDSRGNPRVSPRLVGGATSPTVLVERPRMSESFLFPAVGDEQARHLIVGGVGVRAQVVGDEDFS